MHGYEPPIADPADFAVPITFRMVDTHVHWWDHAEKSLIWDHDWGVEKHAWSWRLDQERWSAPDYRLETAPLGVIKTIHVHHAKFTNPSVAETTWLQSVADRYGWPNGIIGRGYLADSSAPKELERHSVHANFRGVRDLSDVKLIGTDQWNAGYKSLMSLGGVCELGLTFAQFEMAYQVARRFPDHPLVLCHAGHPGTSRLEEYQAAWRTALTKLASAPNVVVKISGLASAAPTNFFAAILQPWIRHCVEAFGPERCMFGSNFHVDRMYVTLPKLFSTYRRAVQDYTLAEQDAMFMGTAERVYRI